MRSFCFLLCFLFFHALAQILGQCLQFFQPVRKPGLADRGSKQPQSAVRDRSGHSRRIAAVCCSSSGRVSSAFCSCRKRIALVVWALARAVLSQVGGVAVGVAVDLVAQLLDRLLRIDLRRSFGGTHKRKDALHVRTALDVNQIYAVAAGAVGRKFMLGQKGFKIPGEIGTPGQEFQIVLFLRIGHGAAAQKCSADVSTDTGLAPDHTRVDLQAGLRSGGPRTARASAGPVPVPGCRTRRPPRWDVLFPKIVPCTPHRANSCSATRAVSSCSVCSTRPLASKYLAKQAIP